MNPLRGLQVFAALLTLIATTRPTSAQDRAIFDFDAPGQPVDISGSGVQATVFGATHTNAGFEGGAYEFDGVNDWIRVALDANPHTDAFPQFTMGAFVRLDTTAPLVQSILSTDNGDFDRTLAVDGRNGAPSWSAFTGWSSFAGPAAAASADWHLVAVVYDRFAVHDLNANLWGNVRLYVDGVEVQAHADPRRSFDFVAIGKNPGFGEHFSGLIDNAFFFSGVLTKSQLDLIRVGGKAALLATVPDNSERERFQHDGFDPEPRAEDVILPAGNMTDTPPEWAFHAGAVVPRWKRPDFDDSHWSRGAGGFGHTWNTWEQDLVRTPWPATERELFLRTTFSLTAADLISRDGSPIALWGRWDDSLEVYINGVPGVLRDPPLHETPGKPVQASDLDGRLYPGELPYAEGLVRPWRYRYVALTEQAMQALVVGENTLAVQVVNLGDLVEHNPRYVDIAVVRNPYDGMPSSGFATLPGTDAFLTAARRFAAKHHIPTVSFAVQEGGRVLAHQTIGYLDKDQSRPAARDTYFRIASLNKAVTASCVRRLMELGFVDPVTGTALTMESHYWPFLLGRGLQPAPGVSPDPRMTEMTIRQMLEHTSGTGYSPSPEILYQSLGADARAWEMARSLYGAPLFFAPGTSTKYSNEAYFLLNYLVRLFTGHTEAFIESEVVQAGAVGIDPLMLSAEQIEDRAPQETWYRTREWPYDRWLYLDDFGHLSVTARGYLHFLKKRSAVGEPIPPWGDLWYFPGGEFSGSTTNAYQEIHGGRTTTSFVLLTNTHDYLLAALWDEFLRILEELPDSRNLRQR